MPKKRNDTIIPLQQVTYVNLSDVMPYSLGDKFSDYHTHISWGDAPYTLDSQESIRKTLEVIKTEWPEYSEYVETTLENMRNLGATVYINLEA